jgi:hypothetical protein
MPFQKIHIFIFFSFLFALNTVFAQIQKDESDPLGFGIKLGVNMPIVGSTYENYSGLAGINLSVFLSKTINNRFTWTNDLGFSSVSFNNTSNDTKFNNYYVELGTFLSFYPSAYNTDLAFIGGIRPSYLMSYNSQVFERGNYNNKTLSINKNEKGRIDATAMIGISVALSPVVNLEMMYNYGLTNKNSESQVLGRPSTVEINIRLNAVALKRSLDNKDETIQEQVENCHKGVVLVMLITPNEKEINRLKAAGKFADAELIENDLKLRNAKVIKEFNKNFAFAPVYYFMDSSIYKVISGNLKGVFVNYNMQSDTAIQVNTSNYVIASFCEDVSEYTKRKHFGLFVYDKGMNQLEKPFNHPNQLASPIFDYVVVNNIENKSRKPSYNTVPFDKLISKLNSRLFGFL